jgi:cytidylate kinase
MIRTITIGGEHGSGRTPIARRLADRLGWRLLDSALIEQIAREAHVDPAVAKTLDECLDSWMHRMHRALWRGGYEGVATAVESESLDADAVASRARCLIESAASEGQCVVVGRGGQCILQDRPDVFHVFVYAPRTERIARLRRETGEQGGVEARMDSIDRVRHAYIRRHFGQEWTDVHLYDLMLSTIMGEEAVVETVLAAIAGAGAR